MKLLPEFQIESISAIEEKKREDKISLYLRVDLSPAKKSSEAVASLPQWKLRHCNKTDGHDIAGILLKVALNTISPLHLLDKLMVKQVEMN